ncbi:hypothetical protein CIK05_15340 [Bdellovibrio sp. qaytius]|nr:hypothetical protein CIK05_15340 [Bdellovibrio sp. qaytius]
MSSQLKNTMDALGKYVASDENYESAFLAALGNMEEMATREITKTINEQTPPNSLLEIISHAQDEHRHAYQLRALKPVKKYQDVKFYHLEQDLSELGVNFVLGFFGQQLLLRARAASRFAGYVHGALTIEQVPLQMYTAYYKLTRNESIKKGLAVVLKDEAAHLALGQKFYENLPAEERFSIDEINAIEAEMCELLGRKMLSTYHSYEAGSPNTDTLEHNLTADRMRLASWISALAENEKAKGASEQAATLAESVLFITGNTNAQTVFTEDTKLIQSWDKPQLLSHYQKLAQVTSLIGVAYSLEKAIRLHNESSSTEATL